MSEQVALVEVPIHEIPEAQVPRVLHDLCAFDLLGTVCQVRTNAEADTLFLRIGQRHFMASVLDLAASTALAVEAHLRGEIRARTIASRATPAGKPGH